MRGTATNTLFDINRFFLIGDKEDCWVWFGHILEPTKRNPRALPYGRFIMKRKRYLAHRLMYEYFYGVNPGSQKVLHTCDNPRCVKPSHLFLGTQHDNVHDGIAKGRYPFPKASPETKAKMRESQKRRRERERTQAKQTLPSP